MNRLIYGDGERRGMAFTESATRFTLKPSSTDDPDGWILLRGSFRGLNEVETDAVLDTGAPYCVLAPWVAERAGLEASGGLRQVALKVRGSTLRGVVDRVAVRLFAEEGDDVEFDALTLIPERASLVENPDLPSFLGLGGVLNVIRFAVDPFDETFYFGTVK